MSLFNSFIFTFVEIKYLMRIIILLLLSTSLTFYRSHAQSAPQTVVASAGAFTTFSGGSMSWTLGEVMTETYAPTGYFFTQGFNQPDTMYLTLVAEPAAQIISVYPNPVVENLVIDFSLTKGAYLIEIMDMQGQLLRKESMPDNQGRMNISFREFANGMYLINVINPVLNTRSSFKINKAE